MLNNNLWKTQMTKNVTRVISYRKAMRMYLNMEILIPHQRMIKYSTTNRITRIILQ